MSRDEISLAFFCVLLMVFTVPILKNIYYEPCFRTKRAWILFWGSFLLAESATLFMEDKDGGYKLGIEFLFFVLLILLSRKKKRIRGIFLYVPVMGILFSMEMIPMMLLIAVSGKNYMYDVETSMSLERILLELIYNIAVFLLFAWILKKNMQKGKTELSRWERNILNINGTLLLLLYCWVTGLPKQISGKEATLVAMTTLICAMVLLSSMLVVVRSANADYYKLQVQMNERYMKAQLKHFESCQAASEETRRIRHDMKNHLLCAKELYESGQTKELGEYLNSLLQVTDIAGSDIHVGNEVADAILNEKKREAEAKKIRLSVEGSMAGRHFMEPVDICSIFANALDNAMEAIEELYRKELAVGTEGEECIRVEIKNKGQFLLLSFQNPMADSGEAEKIWGKENGRSAGWTTKTDKVNHGYGITNIESAAGKYGGEVSCGIQKTEEGRTLFCLDILLNIP